MVVTLRGTVSMDAGSGIYVSRCDDLDVCSQGRDAAEAKVALVDAVRLYVKHCVLRGIFFQILERRGLVPLDDVDSLDRTAAGFDIPLALIADAHKRGAIGGSRISWRP